PPPQIEGELVAGGVLPKGRAFTHPSDLATDLEKAGVPWPINGMSWTTYRNRPDAFLDEVNDVTRARIRAMEWLIDNRDWELASFVFFSTDRVQHCLSNYVPPDHGFQSCTRCVHMDQLLRKLGFLHFSAKQAVFGPMQWGAMRQVARKIYDLLGLHGKVSLPQPVVWSKTRVYTSVRSTGEGVS